MAMVALAFPTIQTHQILSVSMPNAVNFGFDYSIACIVIVIGYLPGFPQLYMYMIKQRRKILGDGASGGHLKRE